MNDGTSPVSSGERALARLLATMSPALDPSHWAVCTGRPGPRPAGLDVLLEFHEREAITCIV
jgi:hypothetical protein